jgi:exosortase/archaeosortase family protein
VNGRFANKKLVAVLALLFLASNLYLQSTSAATPANRLILWTGMVFAGLILFKRPAPLSAAMPTTGILAVCAVAGAVLSIAGVIAAIHQLEWLGLLLLGYAALRWSLPEHYAGNVGAALFTLYWAHPLPGNLFAPLRLAMQGLSVTGAEWTLHLLSIPVWADGLLLRTGARVFEVPEACSGMTTAMIVVVCALGSGAMAGLSPLRRLALMGAGFVQVLLMNSVRIALMVAASWDKPPEWPDRFLHDSTAALLLLMIVLIQCEAVLWNWLRTQRTVWRDYRSAQRAEGHVFGQHHRVPLPRFDLLLIVVPLLLACAVAVFVLDRRRPEFRARMIAGVANELAQRDPPEAERAARAAAELVPDSFDYGLLVARIQLMRGHHAQALALLRRLQPVPRDNMVVQLMAWGLLGSGDLRGAKELLNRLPPDLVSHPGIAVCATELAVMQKDDEQAASNVVIAARWPILTERVRKTFAFLAQRGRWEAIAACNTSAPHRDSDALRTMLVALTLQNDFAGAALLLERNRTLWFANPDLLPHLQDLALRAPDRTWVQRYADGLSACLNRLSPHELTACFEPCFLLGRPDLAWLAYRRLSVLDPGHPALDLVPARFAASWFLYRGGALGTASPTPALFDMRASCRVLSRYPPYAELLPHVPLCAVMLDGPPPAQVAAWRTSGMAKLAAREQRGELAYQDFVLQETCLTATGSDAEVLDVLDRMERRFPERRVEILSRRARLYRARQRWQALYETLRTIKSLRPHLDQPMQLTLAEAMANVEMGVCAIELCDAAVRRRPVDRAGWVAQAAIWDRFGYAEEALFALKDPAEWPPTETLAALLRKTGRYAHAALVYDLVGMKREAVHRPTAIPVLPPADSVLAWPARQGAAAFSREELDRQIKADESPFLKELHTLTRDWGRAPKHDALDGVRRWQGAGRDTAEQVTALHRLAFLAAEAGDRSNAVQALDTALELMPSARLLWRMRIALAGGDPAVVAKARKACPSDPEIWLADVVLELRAGRKDAAAQAVRSACSSNSYSPGTLVRAGYALLRAGDPTSAVVAATQAETQSRDWLPAQFLGLDAATISGDTHRTVSYALKIADLAPDPAPFFRVAVRVGMSRPENQISLTRALDTLIAREPGNSEWALRLGTLYFQEGLTELSRRAFGKWLLAPPAGAEAGVLVMMAESARQSQDLPRSVALLREALRHYPDDIHVINSLAYTLAQSPATAMDARSYLPRLTKAPPTSAILDTIAVVRMHSGEMDAVRAASQEALAKLKPGDPHWREIHLNAAEIECALGNVAAAEKLLRQARAQPPSKGTLVDTRMAELEFRILKAKEASPPQRGH